MRINALHDWRQCISNFSASCESSFDLRSFFAPQLAAEDLPENDPNAEYGLVYFMRGKEIMGSAEGFNALIDDVRECRLKNRRYSVHRVSPGGDTFKAQYGGKKGKKKAEVVSIEIEAGKTYCINMFVHTNFWWPDVNCGGIGKTL